MPERVAALEKNSAYIDQDIDGIAREIGGVEARLKNELDAEAAVREEGDRRVQQTLQRGLAGNLSSLRFGSGWLFIGIALSTFSNELALALNRDWPALLKLL